MSGYNYIRMLLEKPELTLEDVRQALQRRRFFFNDKQCREFFRWLTERKRSGKGLDELMED